MHAFLLVFCPARRGCWMLAVAGVLTVWGGAQLPLPQAVQPIRAMQVSLPGEAGKTYRLQASTDLVNWSAVASSREFGAGAWLHQVNAAAETGKFYRYVVETLPTGGKAPWSVSGTSTEAHVGANVGKYAFTSATEGSLLQSGQTEVIAFTYTAVRTGEDKLQLVVALPGGIQRTLDCHYFGVEMASFTSNESKAGVVRDSVAGVMVPPPPPEPLAATLAHGTERLFIFQESGGVRLVSFGHGGAVLASSNAPPCHIATNYAVNLGVVTFTTGDSNASDTYQLSFADAHCGTFFRNHPLPNLPTVSHHGHFISLPIP